MAHPWRDGVWCRARSVASRATAPQEWPHTGWLTYACAVLRATFRVLFRSNRAPIAILSLLAASCGARTGTIDDLPIGPELPVPQPEICNGLDDDLDGLVASGVLDGGVRDGGLRDGGLRDGGPRLDAGAMDGGFSDGGLRDGGFSDGGFSDGGTVDGGALDLDLFIDEDFRDSLGRYVHRDHCGACNSPCVATGEAIEVECGIVEGSPACIALRCNPGFAPSTTGRCVPIYERLCLTCADDGDCGDLEEASCSIVGGERRCTVSCALGCPDGYTCAGDVCAPEGGSCSCDPGDRFTLACALFDPDENRCAGSAVCDDGVLSECLAPEDVCDEIDNDCDGVVDQAFRDERGAYSLDIHNCGECGVDCTLSTVPEGDLVCGGDPFAPTCVLACPDAADGIMPGDRIDADRDIATGCECTVTSLTDAPGPVRTMGEALDVNCDGADGVVIQSFYVAPDGDDAGPGSPTMPLQTLAVAVRRASESLTMGAARPHIFVASGVYTESVEVPDGVFLHGGYRRDFLALDPDGFRVEVRAPTDTTAPGGAALIFRGTGASETVVEWIEVRGRDAIAAEQATFAIYALDPGAGLTLRDVHVAAGIPGDGMPGMDGASGRDFESPPTDGDVPRGAGEDGAHMCIGGASNTVSGGVGGRNVCGGVDVRGGGGGAPHCPEFAAFQPGGGSGNGAGVIAGGAGGEGGQDSRGPIMGVSCSVDICCGLADFTVPTAFRGPQPGRPGRAGRNGRAGAGCRDAFGAFMGDIWMGDGASAGSGGSPGSGGGGGGGGGGAVMEWFDAQCEFADGLGGGGGGGGSGGCGGDLGSPGSSGAPSVAILLRYTSPPRELPTIERVVLAPSDGARGGDGGAGGAGGRGAPGAFGGSLSREARSTPTLAGPFPGARGGPGGPGGGGGGGGGGCGGASVGVWVLGASESPAVERWRTQNIFMLGRPGIAGRGGGGVSPGGDGAEGGAIDVVVN